MTFLFGFTQSALPEGQLSPENILTGTTAAAASRGSERNIKLAENFIVKIICLMKSDGSNKKKEGQKKRVWLLSMEKC